MVKLVVVAVEVVEEEAEAVRMAEEEVVQVQEEAEEEAHMIMLADALLGRAS